MQDKSLELEDLLAEKISTLGHPVFTVGNMTVDFEGLPLGIWVSVTGEPPAGNRQALTATFHIRSHADTDRERVEVNTAGVNLINHLLQIDLSPKIPDAACLPPGSSNYSLEDGFHVLTFTQQIHIREV